MRFWKLLIIMAASLLLALVFTKAYSQFPTGKFTEVVEYCHIDIIDSKISMHRDFTEEIIISKDSMKIKLNHEDELNYALGGFVYFPKGKARSIRMVFNAEHPDSNLMGMYIADEFVSIRNSDTGATVWFFLKNVCEDLEKLPNDGWFEERPNKDIEIDE